MPYVAGIRATEKGTHRLHDRMNTMLVAIASIATSSTLLVDGKVNFVPGSYVAAGSKLFDFDLRLPLSGPLETALANKMPDRIELNLVAAQAAQKTYKLTTGGFDHVVSHLVTSAFIEFFEAHRHWLRKLVSTDPYKWPPILNFGRVVRNAFGHGGKIYFENKKASPVQWHHLVYGPADDGRQVLYNDLSLGDVLILMFEMSDALDGLGCPSSY